VSLPNSGHELAKKQVALLGKMLLYSIDNLTADEHGVYDSLVEELAARADSKREITNKATTQQPQPPSNKPHLQDRAISYPYEKPDDSHSPQQRKLQGMKPEMVVRLFVECWDKQDFKQEYYTLSDRFEQGKRSEQSVEEYENERYDKYSNRHLTGPISKQVVDVSAPVVDGDMAAVQVAERHSGKTEDMILYRTYNLVFENSAWRIVTFKTNQKRVRKRL
jgi:hypothetical protein